MTRDDAIKLIADAAQAARSNPQLTEPDKAFLNVLAWGRRYVDQRGLPYLAGIVDTWLMVSKHLGAPLHPTLQSVCFMVGEVSKHGSPILSSSIGLEFKHAARQIRDEFAEKATVDA